MKPYITVSMILVLLLIVLSPLTGRGGKEDKGDATVTESTQGRFTFEEINPALLNSLNAFESSVIIDKGTERPFVGIYTDHFEEGTYYCRQCGSPLYSSQDKFHSGCGWPAFDDELPNAVLRYPDADGSRTEIVCATCEGHLGHVFLGERFTDKNTRHCVNSVSLVYKPGPPVAQAVFAGGCFWGVEYLFEKLDGVYSAESGYSGGTLENPTYQDVLSHKSGHLESVLVRYNPLKISYEQLTKYFFEIHDPTQANGQGPDIGNQYLSAVFYRSRHEFDTAVKLVELLEDKGYKIATQIRPAAVFWPAETYHQNYYEREGSQPYCHAYVKRF